MKKNKIKSENDEVREIIKIIGDHKREKGSLNDPELKEKYPNIETFEITEEMIGKDLVWKCR
jgi:hypothetical protein